MRHRYGACALEPKSRDSQAHVPQLLKPAHLRACALQQQRHCNEKPTHRREQPPLAATGEQPVQQQRPSTAKNNRSIKIIKK